MLEIRKSSLVVFLLAASVLIVYSQSGDFPLLFDDESYVSGNPWVLGGVTRDGVSWAFSTYYAANWHPLTWLSLMLDVELFGPSSAWHHGINVVFHLLNVILLFIALLRMTGALWNSAFIAAAFAVHPLHVESVAWVTERKDVLSTFFCFLAMGAYVSYVRHPGIFRYLAVILYFALGLMCKPMLVTLPFVFLLLDVWPLNRLHTSDKTSREIGVAEISTLRFLKGPATCWRLLLEKWPLILLSAISSLVTLHAQQVGGAVGSLTSLPFSTRIANAVVSYVAYFGKTFWPAALSVFYPHPGSSLPLWKTSMGALFVLGGSSTVLWQWKRRPWLAVGWFWFIGTLAPVIGLIQVGAQAMADRYTYVPLIGLFVAVAWGASVLLKSWRWRTLVLGVLGGTAILVLTVVARNQAGYWRDPETLYTHALEVTQNNWLAWNNLGATLGSRGAYAQAIEAYREALRIKPDYPEAWNNLGAIHDNLGQRRHAVDAYRQALRVRPDYPEAWNNLGTTFARDGNLFQAVQCFREALRLKPAYAKAWYNLARAYSILGKPDLADEARKNLGRIDPSMAEELGQHHR